MNHIFDIFKQAILHHRLSHLYILSGSKGQITKDLIFELVYLLLGDGNEDPILESKIKNQNHPNFYYIEKEGQTIKKEQVLELQREFSKTSLVEGRRVFIVEGSDTMSVSAQNSLLKFLEEPKNNETIGILLTDNVNALLPTILSRAQVVRIFDQELTIEKLLEENLSLEHATLASLMTKNLNEAKSLSQDVFFLETLECIRDWIDWFNNHKLSYIYIQQSIFNILQYDKKYLELIFETLLYLCLDIMYYHMNQKLLLSFYREKIQLISNNISIIKAQKMMDIVKEYSNRLKYPVNTQLLITSFLIEMDGIKHA